MCANYFFTSIKSIWLQIWHQILNVKTQFISYHIIFYRHSTAISTWFRKIPIARSVFRYLIPGEGRRSHAIFVSRVHELFGGQRRPTRTLPFLYSTVGWLELGPRYHVQLRYLRCHALLQRATQGKSRIRDRSTPTWSNFHLLTHECWYITAGGALSSVKKTFKSFNVAACSRTTIGIGDSNHAVGQLSE